MNADKFSEKYFNFLVVICVAFVAVLWLIIPLNSFIKAFLFLCIVPFIFLLVVTVSSFVELKMQDTIRTIFVLLIMFVIVPSFLVVHYFLQRQSYLSTYPLDNRLTYNIDVVVDCVSNDGIGTDLIFKHYINGIKFDENEVVSVDCSESLYIDTVIIEDDSVDDIGMSESETISCSPNQDFSEVKEITTHTVVREKGGRSNKGAEAQFEVTYNLKRIVPDDVGFWQILYYGRNIVSTILVTSAFGIDVFCMGIMVVLYLRKKRLSEGGSV